MTPPESYEAHVAPEPDGRAAACKTAFWQGPSQGLTTGDSTFASRARSQQPSGCLR
jgi:hypothetical protein